MITLIQLEYIVAVDKHRNFIKASEACFVTQPTLSMQIKKLEDDLGVVIFDRTKKPVIATEAGRLVIDQARVVLDASKQIEDIVDAFHQKIYGTLTIGIIPTLSPYLLPRFAGSFRRKYPEVSLIFNEMLTDEIYHQLMNDDLDAGIFVTPYHKQRLQEHPVLYEEMMLYAGDDHPILNENEIKVDALKSEEMWLLSDGHCFRNQAINLCEINDLPKRELPFDFEGGSLETLMKIIDREGGFTLLPELAALDLSEEKKNRIKRFSGTKPLREVSLVVSRTYAKTRLINILLEEIKRSVPEGLLDKSRGNIVEWTEEN
jgi:LysR family transcriptional regulator, hydrogen peroxide-inducible genes activator